MMKYDPKVRCDECGELHPESEMEWMGLDLMCLDCFLDIQEENSLVEEYEARAEAEDMNFDDDAYWGHK